MSEGSLEDRAAAIGRIVERAQSIAATDPEWLATDWDKELYDVNGLPR